MLVFFHLLYTVCSLSVQYNKRYVHSEIVIICSFIGPFTLNILIELNIKIVLQYRAAFILDTKILCGFLKKTVVVFIEKLSQYHKTVLLLLKCARNMAKLLFYSSILKNFSWGCLWSCSPLHSLHSVTMKVISKFNWTN